MSELGRGRVHRRLDLPAYANGQRYVFQGWKRAGEVQRSGRVVESSLGCFDAEGWRVLRIPNPRGRFFPDRPSGGLEGHYRQDARSTFVAALIDTLRYWLARRLCGNLGSRVESWAGLLAEKGSRTTFGATRSRFR